MEFIDFLENEIDTRLEGSGLRVVVFEGEEDFIAKFTNPGEFIISVSVAKDDHVVVKMTEAADTIVRSRNNLPIS